MKRAMQGVVRWIAAALVGVAFAAIPAEAGLAPQESSSPRVTAVEPAAAIGARKHDAGPDQLVAAVHVHSSASSGALPMPELAQLARQSGLDVLVLGENLGYEFRYAPAGLRMFGEARVTTETLERHGIARFLEEVAAARVAQPDLLLLAGAEVPPYYYWTGSLLQGDLTLRDLQRNILLIAPVDASTDATHAFFRDVPAVGNPHHREYGTRSLALLVPGLLCVGFAARLLTRPASGAPSRRPAAPAAALLTVGTILLYMNFPYSAPVLAPYSPGAAARAAESVLSHARDHGGLGYWSMPQAVAESERGVGPVTVRLSTVPYPEVLAEPSAYTGFGGVYADTVTLWEAGDAWDKAILAFQSGRRDRPPWIMGESAFHYPGQAGKHIGDVVTVLLVEEQTEHAVFTALSEGSSYALRRDRGHPDIRLGEFSIIRTGTVDARHREEPDTSSAPASAPEAKRAGQTLAVLTPEAIETELVVQVYDTAGSRTPIDVEIIRNGEVHRRVAGATPFEQRWRETLAAGDRSAYYRVVVRATRAAYLVSNPIFIERDR